MGLSPHRRPVNDIEWSWLESGPADGEPIVLLHGFSGSKDNWLLYAPLMGGRYRVICPDLPGFGDEHWSTSVAFRGCVIAVAAILAVLSEVWDIAPTVIINAEARYQNRQAREVYTIPVVFHAMRTFVPGISRLHVTRTDDSHAVQPWTLRFEHAEDANRVAEYSA